MLRDVCERGERSQPHVRCARRGGDPSLPSAVVLERKHEVNAGVCLLDAHASTRRTIEEPLDQRVAHLSHPAAIAGDVPLVRAGLERMGKGDLVDRGHG